MKKYINISNQDVAQAFLDLGVLKEDNDGRLFAVGAIKFTELPVGAAIQDADIAPWVQSGVNVKQPATAVLDYILSYIDDSVTMQDAYDNSVADGATVVNLTLGYTPQYISTVTPVALNPPMTTVQRDALAIPLNSSTIYNVTTNRINCQVGAPAFPTWQEVAWLSDVQATDTQQEVYDNSPDGNINLSTGKHQGYTATDAAFYLPSMTSTQFDAITSPPNGLMGWANDLDRVRLNKGTSGAPVYDTLAYLSDITDITTDGAIGEAYFTGNTTETVIALAATPVIINGTFLPGSNNTNFSQSGARLTNTGAEAFVVRVGITLSAYFAAGATGLMNVYVYKNGSLQANLMQEYSVDGVSSTPKPLPLMGFVLLNPGDYIEPFIENVDSDDNIIVKSINFNANTIGGAGDAGALTWNQTIVNGDGTATATVGKLISVVSSDNAIPPQFGLESTIAPSASDIIGKFPIISDGNEYGSIVVTASSGTPLVNSVVTFNGYRNSLPKQFLQYQGDSGTTEGTAVFTCPVSMANRDLTGVNVFSQNIGTVTFNIGQQNNSFRVNTVSTVDAYTMTYGPTPSDEVANYKIPLTVLGTQNAGVNATLGTSNAPTIIYPSTIYTNAWITLNGTNSIAPNSLAIGQTVVMDIVGVISADFPSPNADPGSLFRLTIGSLPAFVSNGIFSTNFSNGAKLPWTLVIKITRLVSGDIAISAAGYYTNSISLVLPIVFTISADEYAYNPAIAVPITLEFQNNNSPGNTFSFIARSLNIIQYT